MTLETDNQLIAKALAGDRSAAELLTERHRRGVVATAYRALGNADDAQDVAQESLVYALLRLSELRERDRFGAWLHNITLSHCADYRRRRGTRRRGEPITILNEASEEADYLERLLVRRAVEHLPEAHRTTLLLRYVGGWSVAEVSDLLGVPVNTVRSRLMSSKRSLRTYLQPFAPARKTMPVTTAALTLDNVHAAVLRAAFPGGRVLSVQESPESWMPFSPRVRVALPDGAERTVDFRGDIDPIRADLFRTLITLGIPAPRVLRGPVAEGAGGHLCLCEPPAGENLLLWALGGTPHRIRLATERAFDSIDRLHGVTDALLATPAGAALPRRTLADEAEALFSDDAWARDPWRTTKESRVAEWRRDPWFAAASAKVRDAAADIHDPLAFTNYLHYFPNFVRVHPAQGPFDEPLGWPGDARLEQNPVAEYVAPYGHIGDPLLGLAMVWIYDCYPFVHTGFVEQYLWRKGASRRDFAPRLALQALLTIGRQLPPDHAPDDNWAQSLRGYAEQGLAWM